MAAAASSSSSTASIRQSRPAVPLSAFAFLFSELVQYHCGSIAKTSDLELKCVARCARGCRRPSPRPFLQVLYHKSDTPPHPPHTHSPTPTLLTRVCVPCRLKASGNEVGRRYYELSCYTFRERRGRRETDPERLLTFIQKGFWKSLFGKEAEALQRTAEAGSYMIREVAPVTNKFISIPTDYGSVNCASFIAGIIQGALLAASFESEVSAHLNDGMTVYLVKLLPGRDGMHPG